MGLKYKPAPQSVTMASRTSAEQRNAEEMLSALSTEVVQGPLANSQSDTLLSIRGYNIDSFGTQVHPWRNANQVHPWWNADQVPAPCPLCKQVPPCPRFLVAIPHPSKPANPEEDLSLAVPGRFWELHSNMLQCDELQLRGPNKAVIKVKVKKTYNEEEQKLNVRLESNWKAFFLANDLQAGDILEFFLVASSCFTVYRLER